MTDDEIFTDGTGQGAGLVKQGKVMSTNVFLRDDGVEVNTRANLAGSISIL